jgi:protein involved in polysaccharide export with SLBB domain
MQVAKVTQWALILAVGVSATAQAQGNPDARRAQTSRAELEALLNQAGATLDPAERVMLQNRLTNGDFQVGDRIGLTVLQDPTLSDTFTVKVGRTITLPNIPDISLHGVLRSEVEEHLSAELSKYLREPTVEAVALIRIGILGSVGRPGYYAVPAQTLLSDVIMIAGGPSSTADPKKIDVHRQSTKLLNRDETQAAIAYGTTLDRLNIQGGDEIRVGDKSNFVTSFQGIAILITAPLALLFAVGRVF